MALEMDLDSLALGLGSSNLVGLAVGLDNMDQHSRIGNFLDYEQNFENQKIVNPPAYHFFDGDRHEQRDIFHRNCKNHGENYDINPSWCCDYYYYYYLLQVEQ